MNPQKIISTSVISHSYALNDFVTSFIMFPEAACSCYGEKAVMNPLYHTCPALNNRHSKGGHHKDPNHEPLYIKGKAVLPWWSRVSSRYAVRPGDTFFFASCPAAKSSVRRAHWGLVTDGWEFFCFFGSWVQGNVVQNLIWEPFNGTYYSSTYKSLNTIHKYEIYKKSKEKGPIIS